MFAVMCTVPASAVTLTLTGVVLFGSHMQRQALVLHTLPLARYPLPIAHVRGRTDYHVAPEDMLRLGLAVCLPSPLQYYFQFR